MAAHWNDDEKSQVVNLLRQFNGAAEVCAVMGCSESELDDLCRDAFSSDFETTRARFSAQGRALVRKSLMQKALDGDIKAIDMLAREQLGMDPVKARKAAVKPEPEKPAESDQDKEAALLKFIPGAAG